MAVMFTIIYPDSDTAAAALNTVESLENAGYMTVRDRAVLKKEQNGKVDVDETLHPVRRGAVVGGVLGGVVGAVFLLPVAGAAAGAALGGVLGQSAKSGASSDFRSFSDSVQIDMNPGDSAIVLFADSDARDRVVHELGKHGGTLHSFDLAEDQIAAIQREIDKESQN